ncbi:hypothetical protein PNOK_0113600 [Pyrrhoderma noxium]|uniref:Uncharacterized protein n=1 Tax=Pyrrhoderma noxium TaxID=2282107 RepID=A0A286UWW2_9AGAM|nr:hypothetical protein PNOK_0113600 [Pyrrhoderma noxium]
MSQKSRGFHLEAYQSGLNPQCSKSTPSSFLRHFLHPCQLAYLFTSPSLCIHSLKAKKAGGVPLVPAVRRSRRAFNVRLSFAFLESAFGAR